MNQISKVCPDACCFFCLGLTELTEVRQKYNGAAEWVREIMGTFYRLLFTASLSVVPARKVATNCSGIAIGSWVFGFLATVAFLLFLSKVPNPEIVIFSPFATHSRIVSVKQRIIFSQVFGSTCVRFATSTINSDLVIA